MHSVMKVAPPFAAAGHQKSGVGEPVFQESIQNAINRAAGAGQNFNVDRDDGCCQCRGDRAAYQDVNPQDRQAPGPAQGVLGVHFERNPPRLPAVFNVDKKKAAGGVEYRRDAPLPLWNRNFHYIADASNAYANQGSPVLACCCASPGLTARGYWMLFLSPTEPRIRVASCKDCRMQLWPALCVAICTSRKKAGYPGRDFPISLRALPPAARGFSEKVWSCIGTFFAGIMPRSEADFCSPASRISI